MQPDSHESNENQRIPCENHEKHENHIIPTDNYKKMKIIELHLRITKTN